MIKFLVKWLINAAALMLVVQITAKISFDGILVLLTAALIIGLFNAFLKPFILIITLPINIVSLGVFTLFINGFLFWLASKLVPGFYVSSFWGAVWAALLFSVASIFLNLLTGGSKWEIRKQRYGARENTRRKGSIDAEIVGEETEGRLKIEDGRKRN